MEVICHIKDFNFQPMMKRLFTPSNLHQTAKMKLKLPPFTECPAIVVSTSTFVWTDTLATVCTWFLAYG